MINGLTLEGQALGITQISAAQLQAAVTVFSNADNAFNAGRSARQDASDAFQSADGMLEDWLGVVKTVLAGRFGQRWSTVWAQAGFINHSTAIPSKIEDRIALAGRLVAFFTANPNCEVPSMLVTAAQGTALLGTITTTQNALTAATKALKTLDGSWQNAYTALTDLMWSLIKILQASLADNDPRWLEFGLPMPITPSTPGKPVNVTAHTDDTGAIVVQCDPVPLATRYRWRTLVVGVQTEYELAASSVDPIASIADVAPRQTVQIIVQAVNGSLQGVASDPIVFTFRSGKSAEPPKVSSQDAPAEKAASKTDGNGSENGNGHRAHSRAA